jgi:hypothetical protein
MERRRGYARGKREKRLVSALVFVEIIMTSVAEIFLAAAVKSAGHPAFSGS